MSFEIYILLNRAVEVVVFGVVRRVGGEQDSVKSGVSLTTQ